MQQANEMLRRNKDRDERLKTLQNEAAGLSADAKRLEQQRAQLEAELAEAHRERYCALGAHHDHLPCVAEGLCWPSLALPGLHSSITWP